MVPTNPVFFPSFSRIFLIIKLVVVLPFVPVIPAIFNFEDGSP